MILFQLALATVALVFALPALAQTTITASSVVASGGSVQLPTVSTRLLTTTLPVTTGSSYASEFVRACPR